MKQFKIYRIRYITNKLPELSSYHELYHLNTSDVLCEDNINDSEEIYTKTHPDGWTISGQIDDYECWREWVSKFTAHHPVYGNIFSDLTNFNVISESLESYNHFITYHPINSLDLWDE